ncbi:MAG: hypothetical protein ABSG43_28165, partial [Solirubrobacteraceae bacterium]
MTRELIMRAGFIARLSAAAKAVATLIVALGVVLVAAAAAQATQTPQLTLMINTQGGAGCGLLVPFGSSAALSASPCNGGPLSLTFPSPASAPVVTSSAPQPASSSPFALNPDLEFGPDVAQGSAGGGVPAGTAVGYQIDAPPGFTFTGMPALSQGPTSGVATGKGWGGATYWACSSTATVPASSKCPQGWRSQAPNKAGDEQQAAGQQNAATFPYGSGIWGVVMVCGWARCSNPARMTLNSVELTATETQTPTITPVGDNNLLDQAVPGRWVWNEPASPWNAAVSASDPSGICGISGSVNNNQVSDPSSATPVLSQWQQCPANPTWPLSIDTREYITGAGQLPITMSAQNAAEADSQIPAEPSASLPTQTVAVDNDPVNVVLTTPDDPNPTVWVNHAVTADVTASSGPSGLGSVVCAVDGGAPQSLPGAGGQTMNGQVTLNGDGVHVLICTASNTAVDPNGLHNTGTNSITVHIDQAGPSVSIEPVSEHPNDPTSVVADTSDSESGVAGGSIAMAPDGSSDWTSLPTTFSNGQLLAHFDDSSLAAGAWQLRARSCDNVGNCSTTTQALTLPLRSAATSNVSLQSINPECSAPATTGLRAVRPRSSGGVGLA